MSSNVITSAYRELTPPDACARIMEYSLGNVRSIVEICVHTLVTVKDTAMVVRAVALNILTCGLCQRYRTELRDSLYNLFIEDTMNWGRIAVNTCDRLLYSGLKYLIWGGQGQDEVEVEPDAGETLSFNSSGERV